jgi:hypothetical protein
MNEQMPTIANCYFKVPFGGKPLMSGLVMPDPAGGPYHFDGCDFHPALWDVLKRDYKNCKFTNCD